MPNEPFEKSSRSTKKPAPTIVDQTVAVSARRLLPTLMTPMVTMIVKVSHSAAKGEAKAKAVKDTQTTASCP